MPTLTRLTGPGMRDHNLQALPAAEAAMLAFVAIIAGQTGDTRVFCEPWSNDPQPHENGKPLHGLSVFRASRATCEALKAAIDGRARTWRFNDAPDQAGCYIYDSRV